MDFTDYTAETERLLLRTHTDDDFDDFFDLHRRARRRARTCRGTRATRRPHGKRCGGTRSSRSTWTTRG